MAAEERTAPLIPGDRGGDDGSGFRWHTRIAEIASAPLTGAPLTGAPLTGGDTTATPAGPRAILYTVAVSIVWQGGQVSLATERVAAAPRASP
jgi:hypothetical protein